MEIREGNINDARGIARVHIDTWRSTYRGLIPDERLDSMDLDKDEEMQKRFISQESVSTYVCVNDEDEIIGYVCCGDRRDGPQEYTGELYGLYILKEYQGQGIGRKMVNKVIEKLKSKGHKSMLLWALKENSSCRFYERLGGKLVGEQYLTYAGKQVEAVAYGWEEI